MRRGAARILSETNFPDVLWLICGEAEALRRNNSPGAEIQYVGAWAATFKRSAYGFSDFLVSKRFDSGFRAAHL